MQFRTEEMATGHSESSLAIHARLQAGAELQQWGIRLARGLFKP